MSAPTRPLRGAGDRGRGLGGGHHPAGRGPVLRPPHRHHEQLLPDSVAGSSAGARPCTICHTTPSACGTRRPAPPPPAAECADRRPLLRPLGLQYSDTALDQKNVYLISQSSKRICQRSRGCIAVDGRDHGRWVTRPLQPQPHRCVHLSLWLLLDLSPYCVSINTVRALPNPTCPPQCDG